jgi:hypothetical protein
MGIMMMEELLVGKLDGFVTGTGKELRLDDKYPEPAVCWCIRLRIRYFLL